MFYYFSDPGSMHGSLIVGMELRISQIEDKLSDVDARASEEADCNANDRDLDRFIYSGWLFSIFFKLSITLSFISQYLKVFKIISGLNITVIYHSPRLQPHSVYLCLECTYVVFQVDQSLSQLSRRS